MHSPIRSGSSPVVGTHAEIQLASLIVAIGAICDPQVHRQVFEVTGSVCLPSYFDIHDDEILNPLDADILNQLEAYQLLEIRPCTPDTATPPDTPISLPAEPVAPVLVVRAESPVLSVSSSVDPPGPASEEVSPIIYSRPPRRKARITHRGLPERRILDAHILMRALGTIPASVRYNFSSLGHQSMLLMPPLDAPNTQPLYHVSWREEFWASGTIVTVRKGGSEDGECVGQFRAQPWPGILDSKPESWPWTADNVVLRWSEEESAYGLPIRWFKCVVMPKNRTGKPLHIASLKPPAYTLSTTNSLNRVAVLEVTPAGMSKMDDVVTSALYVHRMELALAKFKNSQSRRFDSEVLNK